MKRALQALGIVAAIFASAAIGLVAGVALMAAGEAPAAPAPAPPNRWERAI